jgi:hypothetical protein
MPKHPRAFEKKNPIYAMPKQPISFEKSIQFYAIPKHPTRLTKNENYILYLAKILKKTPSQNTTELNSNMPRQNIKKHPQNTEPKLQVQGTSLYTCMYIRITFPILKGVSKENNQFGGWDILRVKSPKNDQMWNYSTRPGPTSAIICG